MLLPKAVDAAYAPRGIQDDGWREIGRETLTDAREGLSRSTIINNEQRLAGDRPEVP